MDTAAIIEALPKLDLEKIRAEIATKEEALEAIVAEHRKSIDALRQLERIANIAQNGVIKKGPRTPRAARVPAAPSAGGTLTVRQRAALYLATNGPTRFRTVIESLQCNSGILYQFAASDPWFEKKGELLCLTEQGKRANSG